MAEPLRVPDDVNLGDLPVAHHEGHDRERFSLEHDEQPGCAVDEHRPPEQGQAGEVLRLTSHLLRTANLARSTRLHRSGVGSEDHLPVEDSDEPVEIAVLRSRPKGLDHPSLNFRVGSGSGVARLNAAACAAGKLPGRIGGALEDSSDLLEGDAEDIMQHERDVLGRNKLLEYNHQSQPDAAGQQRGMLCIRSVSAV
jgi:hypothetical protein